MIQYLRHAFFDARHFTSIGDLNTFSVWAIAHRLDQRARARRTPPPVPVLLPADPRVGDLRVAPHRLTDYDGLFTTPAPREDPDGPAD